MWQISYPLCQGNFFQPKSHKLAVFEDFAPALTNSSCSSLQKHYLDQKWVQRALFNPQPGFGCKLKNIFFAKFCPNLLAFLPFPAFFAWKSLKRHVLTSLWSAQHPNAGGNIQQMKFAYWYYYRIDTSYTKKTISLFS